MLSVQAVNDRTERDIDKLIRQDPTIIPEIAQEIAESMIEEAARPDDEPDEVRMMMFACAMVGLSRMVEVSIDKLERRARRKKREEGDGDPEADDPG